MLNKIKIAERIPSCKQIYNEGVGAYISAPRQPGFYSLYLLANDQHKGIGWQWKREEEAIRK